MTQMTPTTRAREDDTLLDELKLQNEILLKARDDLKLKYDELLSRHQELNGKFIRESMALGSLMDENKDLKKENEDLKAELDRWSSHFYTMRPDIIRSRDMERVIADLVIEKTKIEKKLAKIEEEKANK